MTDLKDVLIKARARLTEYRFKRKSNDNVSIHMNALEIAICLTEFSLKTNPTRPISKEEEQWFRAGFEIDQILVHSEWEDIIDLYYKIVGEVRKEIFLDNLRRLKNAQWWGDVFKEKAYLENQKMNKITELALF